MVMKCKPVVNDRCVKKIKSGKKLLLLVYNSENMCEKNKSSAWKQNKK